MSKEGSDKSAGFDASLEALEKIAARLESGDLTLERSLELFEQGIALARRCQAQLEDAERRVEAILNTRTGIGVVPFEPTAGPKASSLPDDTGPDKTEDDDDDDDDDDGMPF